MKINVKKVTKIISIVMIVAMLIALVTPVFAVDPATIKANENNTGKITSLGSQIIGIVTTIGSVVAVLVLVVLGVKYMMGSAEEKAEYKKTLMPYVIGAVLVFAASTIAGVIFSFSQNIQG